MSTENKTAELLLFSFVGIISMFNLFVCCIPMYAHFYYKYDPCLKNNLLKVSLQRKLFDSIEPYSRNGRLPRPTRAMCECAKCITDHPVITKSDINEPLNEEETNYVTLADVEKFKGAKIKDLKGPLARIQSDVWSYTNSSVGDSTEFSGEDLFSDFTPLNTPPESPLLERKKSLKKVRIV